MELLDYFKDNLHIDPIIVLIVIASGFFSKRYLKGFALVITDEKADDAFKTLLVSLIVSAVYLALIGLPREMWAQYFISYFLATSLYEIIVRPISKVIKAMAGSKGKDDN